MEDADLQTCNIHHERDRRVGRKLADEEEDESEEE